MTTPYYQDDQVTLYHGDSREIDAWLQADVLVTDPPYGMAYHPRFEERHGAITGDESTDSRDQALRQWGSRPGLVFGTWRITKPACVRNVLIWDKGTNLGLGMSTPWGFSHEEIYVVGEWPMPVPGGRTREGGTPSRVPSVLRVDKPNNKPNKESNKAASNKVFDHPTPKPVGLLERLIDRCPTGVIADPFAGSGSTLIAARNLRRKAIGVEIEERYCELIARRLDQMCLDLGEPA